VSFSEKPFSPVISGAGAEATFCGQIDDELAGQSVVVAGRILSARYLLTRDGRSFASAILEDFSGQVEVMVWPKVYAETGDLWKDGNEIVVQGKVRMRDDRVQISCDSARHYQPPKEKEPAVLTKPAPAEAAGEATVAETVPAESRRLVIDISQTSDENGDIARLSRIMAVIKQFPGRDEVQLNIVNDEEATNLKLSNIHANYCPELHQRLAELVGEDNFRIETVS
jgi:DNA polymerase-3 subunit alpha